MINALIFLFLTSSSFATITNFSVAGASRVYDPVGTTGLYEIWAGTAASGSCGSTSTTTCNTCGTGTIDPVTKSCNVKAVGQGGQISFTFRSDKTISNPMPFILTTDSDTGVKIGNSSNVVASGATGTLTVAWSDICNAFTTGSSANCLTGATQTFRVGLNANEGTDDVLTTAADDYIRVTITVVPEITVQADVEKDADCTQTSAVHGICDYALVRGDEKAYLATFGYASGFPTISGVKYAAIRMYYAKTTGACSAATYNHSQYSELALGKSGLNYTANIVGDGAISGLTNGESYCFRGAVVDKAGNVRGYTIPVSMNDATHKVTPEEVNGLLDEGNCFIATAAYGNPLNEKIDTFRQFRDEILLKFSWGQKMVAFYYENSKPLAIEIFKHPWAQTMTRAILWPLWFVIEVILNYPIFLVLTGALLIASARRRKNAI